jgi:ubiquinone/menaquinone biosynthesis C-methylase UbiE
MMIYIVVFLLVLYLFLTMSEKEGFSVSTSDELLQNKVYTNEKIYDNFYTYIYDDVMLSIPYSIELVQMIRPYLYNSSHVLCLGSRTGHLVQLLSDTTKVTGLDSSKSMVKMSQYKYPKNEYVYGSYIDSSLFPMNKFSQVILPLWTVHTIPNFKELCFVVKEWTVHSGFFFVCFTDLATLPVRKMVNHHPSSYFTSNYKYSVEINNSKLVETIEDINGKERINKQDLYPYTEESLIQQARPSGFIHVKTLRYESLPLYVCIFQHK